MEEIWEVECIYRNYALDYDSIECRDSTMK